MKRIVPSLSVLCMLLPLSLAASTSWPHARGPAFDGRASSDAFSSDDVSLDIAWRIPLGSGYSGIVVDRGRAVTLYSEGDGDWAGAFDVKSGERLWRYRLGDRYEGHDGSDDGPLSSPSIRDGRVIALAPRGRLVALDLEDGSEIWTRDLAVDLGAAAPTFGFTTSPAFSGDLLVVQAGGKDGRALVGLDPKSGETRWAHSDDTVTYQSPIVMRLAGRNQVVAVSESLIVGVAADTGDLLWQHPLGEDRAGSAIPTFIGKDRFLVAMGGGVTAYQVSGGADGLSVAELYRSNVLGRKYAPPVYHQGYVYGLRGSILTCMKADDGSRVWRSRPPGGESLMLVGDRLVIFAAGGDIVLADASPAGYTERARVPALEGASMTWPSFAENRIFVRNLEEMAAVSIGRKGVANESDTLTANVLSRWIERIAAAKDKAAVVEKLLDASPGGPLIDGDTVHFLLRSDSDDVVIAGSMLDGAVEPMARVPGTDLFYRSFALEPGLRWEYRFQLDFETWKTDPRNPRTVPTMGRGEMSELVSGGYAVAEHLDEPATPRGTQETFTIDSLALGTSKEIAVWLPPGYAGSGLRYPLLVVNEGLAWRDKGLLMRSLDNLVGQEVAPVVVAFVEASGAWWEEAGGSKVEAYVRMQADELLPMLAARYRLSERAEDRAVLGLRYYGASALFAALSRPNVFGKAALLSPHLGMGVDQEIGRRVRLGDGKQARLYLDWNRFDEKRLDRGISFGDAARALDRQLRTADYAVTGGEVADSGGWGGWRNRNDRFLRALFPIASTQ